MNLTIETREGSGKKLARRLRHEGFIPGVIYGSDKAPVSISISARELIRLCYSSSFFNTIFDIKIGKEDEKIIPRDIAFHPVKDTPVHVDFQRIDKNSKVKVNVPIEFINEDKSPGLKKGAVLNIVHYHLECYCSVASIPEKFVFDLTGKEIGDGLTVGDLKLSDTLKTLPSETVIATLVGAKTASSDDSDSEGSSAEEQSAS